MGARSTTPLKRLGAWLARTDNTVYLAATDGFVHAFRTAVNGSVEILTDGANPPTTIRTKDMTPNGVGEFGCAESAVKKGDYWKAVGAITGLYWIPLEP